MKITRSASRGTSSNSRTSIACLRPPAPVGTAAHIPWSSWRRKGLDEAGLVLGQLRITLREQLIAVPRLHADELHVPIMAAADAAAGMR